MNNLLIKNINIFDPEDSSMKYNQNILIKDDIIQSVSADLNDNIEAIDGTNKFAIAGMFECHAHLAPLTTQDKKFQRRLLKHITNNEHSWDGLTSLILEGFINKGITQIRDVGGPVNNLFNLSNKIKSNQIAGPDIFYSGPMLESAPLTWKSSNSFLPDFTVAIDSVNDLRILDDIKAKGASLVKTFGRFNENIYGKLLEKARLLNLPVTHDPGKPLFNVIPMNKAIEMGATCIEHSKALLPCVLKSDLQSRHDKFLDIFVKLKNENPKAIIPKKIRKDSDAIFYEVGELREEAICEAKLSSLLEKTLNKDFYFCPTLHVWEDMSGESESKNPIIKIISWFNRKDIEAIKSIRFLSFYFAKRMINAGTKILVGQDGFFPDNTYREMELLEEAGLSIAEIIKGATIYPAKWLKIDNLYGSIVPTKKANICILNNNPLQSLSNIKDVNMVIKNGRIAFKQNH